MTTTDANGIVYLQDTDDISPFHTLINVLQSGTSNALNARIRIARVANVTERNALATTLGASPTNPIYTHRADAPLGQNLEVTAGGSVWMPVGGETFTGLEGVFKGVVPPAGTRKIRYESSIIYTTNGFGQFAVAFPVAFPNGIVSIVATPGDTAANFGQAQFIRASTTLAIGVGNAFTVTGSVINNLAICVNYVAIGW